MTTESFRPVTSGEQIEELMQQGWTAERSGQRARARRLYSAVLHKNPTHVQAWLELASVLDDPEEAARHLAYVLTLEPGNRRAQKSLKKLRLPAGSRPQQPAAQPPLTQPRVPIPHPLVAATVPRGRRRVSVRWLAVGVLLLVAAMLAALWSGLPQTVLAALVRAAPSGAEPASGGTAAPTQLQSPVLVFTSTSTPPPANALTPSEPTMPVPAPRRTESRPAETASHSPSSQVVLTSVPTASATDPGEGSTVTATIAVVGPGATITAMPTPTPTPEPGKVPPDKSESEKWIEVDLSQQKLYAHEGQETVLVARVSTGTSAYPTVTGRFKVYVKYRSAPMSGPGYYLPGVPWIMYFYKGYAIHGAYWHNNFGHPMSHGCINMKVNEAKWLYNWAPKGILVVIHR